MANIKEALAASTPLTITLDSLAASTTVGRASTAVDNTSNLYLDAALSLVIVTTSTAPGGNKALYVYVYGNTDDVPNYSDGITGTDAAFTRTDPPNVRYLTTVNLPTASKTYPVGPLSVALPFGGFLPARWGIACFNDYGSALGTGCSAAFKGVYATST